MGKTYEQQLLEQVEQYRDTENMHDLPPVFHLWSSTSIGPGLREVFGVDNINAFYVGAFTAAAGTGTGTPAFLSLGCGDGAVEIAIAQTLLDRGTASFRFVCYDLSPPLLDRFRAAMPRHLAPHFELVEGDLNARTFDTQFDAVMANHSLHHMVDLEGMFRTIYNSLAPRGIFVTSDMIGRNGHMRWPEARLFVDFFWPFLTMRQRRNVQLRRAEAAFLDHDCSTEAFEGVRAQDVLPAILAQGFQPWKFMGFGGMVDVFVDRGFGPNFDVDTPDDAFLARRIGFLNDILLDAGLVKPTMMLAYFTKDVRPDAACFRNRTAVSALRDPGTAPAWLAAAAVDFAPCRTDPDFVFRDRVPTAAAGHPPSAADHGHLIAALRHAQQEASILRAAAETQACRLAAMQASTSWQLTGPLRAAARLFRRW